MEFTPIKPMLCMATESNDIEGILMNPDFVFETKWDGIRCVAFIQDGEVLLQNRRGDDITKRFPEVVSAFLGLASNGNDFILDGELVIFNKEGLVDFNLIQHRSTLRDKTKIDILSQTTPCLFVAFDMLKLNNDNMMQQPYVVRRKIMQTMVPTLSDGEIKISEFVEHDKSMELWQHISKMGIEGIVAKRKDSVYAEGKRSPSWLKLKRDQTEDCIVVGFTPGTGKRINTFGALVLVQLDPNNDGKQVYVGKVGTGFNDAQLLELKEKLELIKTDKPLEIEPDIYDVITPVQPLLVAEIHFLEKSSDGIFRFPSFARIRNDKAPIDCTISQEVKPQDINGKKKESKKEKSRPEAGHKFW